MASSYSNSMDALPKTHVLTVEEKAFVDGLDQKHKELHAVAVEWLQTSYRPEWSHMWTDSKLNPKAVAKAK